MRAGYPAADGLGPVEAVIFDCDGTLVDSERPWLQVVAEQIERLEADIAPEGLMGLPARQAAQALVAAAASARSAVSVEKDISRRYSLLLRECDAPMPGVRALLGAIDGVVPAAVASNGRGEDVRALLDAAGIADHFDAVVSIDDVVAGKPSPDIYLEACKRISVPPGHVLVVEDSPAGAAAARAAGCRVLGVNADLTIELDADARIPSLEKCVFDATNRRLILRGAASSTSPTRKVAP